MTMSQEMPPADQVSKKFFLWLLLGAVCWIGASAVVLSMTP